MEFIWFIPTMSETQLKFHFIQITGCKYVIFVNITSKNGANILIYYNYKWQNFTLYVNY